MYRHGVILFDYKENNNMKYYAFPQGRRLMEVWIVLDRVCNVTNFSLGG